MIQPSGGAVTLRASVRGAQATLQGSSQGPAICVGAPEDDHGMGRRVKDGGVAVPR